MYPKCLKCSITESLDTEAVMQLLIRLMINAKNMEAKNTGAKPMWLIFSLERISAINKPQSMIDSVAPASDGWLNPQSGSLE